MTRTEQLKPILDQMRKVVEGVHRGELGTVDAVRALEGAMHLIMLLGEQADEKNAFVDRILNDIAAGIPRQDHR